MPLSARTALPALGVAAVAFVGLAPIQVQGHAYMMEPVSRNFHATTAFQTWDYPDLNYCPHCFQSRGPGAVRARGEDNTDPDELAKYGGGAWPHLTAYNRGELTDNGNYKENNEIAKRHGICGDPEQTKTEGSNLYGKANSNYNVLQTYEEGGVMEVKVVFSTYHWGHLELFICDSKDLSDPHGVVTQECFNMNPLTRLEDDGDASPIDPSHPGRYYVDPVCRATDSVDPTDQERVPGATSGHITTGRYRLPSGLTCTHCIVQMVYYTGNSCKHPGYDEFEPTSLPGSCAPEKENWIQTSLGLCGENGRYPEEFWNCADIEITADGDPSDVVPLTPAPVPDVDTPEVTYAPYPKPTPVPVPEVTYAPYPKPTPVPVPEVTYAPYPKPTPVPVQDADPFDNDHDDVVACDDPADAYEQCGGADSYDGRTCCVEGYECVEMADCYSECRPTEPETVEENCSGEWQQCGGNDWEGPTCCDEGNDCVNRGDWYSQCVPETIGW